MKSNKFEVIRGVVSELRVGQFQGDLVSTDADKVLAGASAVGLALNGLAGAATSAALSGTDTTERVDFFVCKIGDRRVQGRFGKVYFEDGDLVEAVCRAISDLPEAYAVTRSSDRTIWMYPHCGRGSKNYLKYCVTSIFSVSIAAPGIFIGALMAYSYSQPDNPFPLWFWPVNFLIGMALFGVILGVVAARFKKFSYLADDIFSALGFEKPQHVNLYQRLRRASNALSNAERLKYHPHARWVYKY